MNGIQRYFVEEFVQEYFEGHMSRRDMMRRVLLITGGVASAATTLIALGCGSNSSSAPLSGAANVVAGGYVTRTAVRSTKLLA